MGSKFRIFHKTTHMQVGINIPSAMTSAAKGHPIDPQLGRLPSL